MQGYKDRCLAGHRLSSLYQLQTLPWRARRWRRRREMGRGQVVYLGGTG